MKQAVCLARFLFLELLMDQRQAARQLQRNGTMNHAHRKSEASILALSLGEDDVTGRGAPHDSRYSCVLHVLYAFSGVTLMSSTWCAKWYRGAILSAIASCNAVFIYGLIQQPARLFEHLHLPLLQ